MERIHWNRVQSALINYGKKYSDEMKKRLKSENKVASGKLINSLTPYLEEEENKYTLYIDMAAHGPYVDSGRRAGIRRPPISSIKKWMETRGIRPDGRPGGAKTQDQLAFLIQRKIGIRGISATPFLYIWFNNINELNEIILNAATDDIEKEIKNYIEKNK